MTDPPKGTGPGVYMVTDPPKGTGPGVYTVTDPFGTGTVPKTGPAFLEADRERIDATVSRSRVNKRPFRFLDRNHLEPTPYEHSLSKRHLGTVLVVFLFGDLHVLLFL